MKKFLPTIVVFVGYKQSAFTHYYIMDEELKYREIEKRLRIASPDEVDGILSEMFFLLGLK